MSDTILVLLKHLDDLAPARALVAALPERSFAFSFHSEDLRTRFGVMSGSRAEPRSSMSGSRAEPRASTSGSRAEPRASMSGSRAEPRASTQHATTTDPLSHVLDPEQVGLALCFSGAREASPTSNFLQLSFFEEVGIPTLELQRDLLRDPELAARESAARHYLPWSGRDGIGCCLPLSRAAADTRSGSRADPRASTSPAARDDLVLVSSELAHPAYNEEERFRFALAVIRLAREHPHLSFLWRSSAAEEQSAEAWSVLGMLGSSAPSNIWLEENEPLDELTARASAVLCMAQTQLIGFAAREKPALVYVSDTLAPRLAELSYQRFTQPSELLAGWAALRSEPARFLVQSRVPALDAQKLRARLAAIESTRRLREDRREIITRYFAYIQEARARADLGRIGPQVNAMEKRLAELEKTLGALQGKLANGQARSPLDLGQLKVAQRAMKLVARVRKRGLRAF